MKQTSMKQKRSAKQVQQSPQSPWTPAPLAVATPISPSLRDAAYDAIKHRIITCVFKPGDYLNEALVSETIGIGRTPVHQAVDRLMQDGLLEVIPRKGVIVKPIGLDEVAQIIDVRRINEPYCARLAAQRADHVDVSVLGEILNRADAWTELRNIEQMMLADREFHMALARAAKNAVLSGILQNLHERSLRFWFISLTAQDHHREVQKEHRAILEAIRTRAVDAAEQAMIDHINSFSRNVTRYLERGSR
jgi:GntR family transcriptional regulator, rspAB operon transcriptional repressor